MRVMIGVISCMLLIPPGVLETSAYGEPAAKRAISFGLPFKCGATAKSATKSAVDSEGYCNGLCLSDRFKPGLVVALISKTGVYRAKTGEKCNYSYMWGSGEVTQLVGTEKYVAGVDKEELFTNAPFDIAVVGVEPTAIRLLSQKVDKSPLPKDAESKARRLLESSDPYETVSDSPPQVLRVKNVALLQFEASEEKLRRWGGPPVLWVNNRVFRLQGWCTHEHVFFSVNDKLHLAYWSLCCECGWLNKLVYDLSGGTPKQVYVNGDLGD